MLRWVTGALQTTEMCLTGLCHNIQDSTPLREGLVTPPSEGCSDATTHGRTSPMHSGVWPKQSLGCLRAGLSNQPLLLRSALTPLHMDKVCPCTVASGLRVPLREGLAASPSEEHSDTPAHGQSFLMHSGIPQLRMHQLAHSQSWG